MPDAGETDEQIFERFRSSRDAAALGVLAARHELMLLGLCCGVLRGRHELAMDAVQETWVRVIRSADTFASRSSFKTWIYRIALNQCRTLLKKSGRGVGGTMGDSLLVPSQGDPVPGELTDAVRNAVGGMTDHKAEVLLLCYHAGLTHEQAADVLEIPLGTLKSRLHAALSELRRTLPTEVTQ